MKMEKMLHARRVRDSFPNGTLAGIESDGLHLRIDVACFPDTSKTERVEVLVPKWTSTDSTRWGYYCLERKD